MVLFAVYSGADVVPQGSDVWGSCMPRSLKQTGGDCTVFSLRSTVFNQQAKQGTRSLATTCAKLSKEITPLAKQS